MFNNPKNEDELDSEEIVSMPSPTQLLAMSEEERQKWIDLSFELAKDMDFEIFDAFGEKYF
jgi:hypothetical protein